MALGGAGAAPNVTGKDSRTSQENQSLFAEIDGTGGWLRSLSWFLVGTLIPLQLNGGGGYLGQWLPWPRPDCREELLVSGAIFLYPAQE